MMYAKSSNGCPTHTVSPKDSEVQVIQENPTKNGRKFEMFNCGIQVEYVDEDTYSDDGYEDPVRSHYLEQYGINPILINGRIH